MEPGKTVRRRPSRRMLVSNRVPNLTNYEVRIKGVNRYGAGENSEEKTFKTDVGKQETVPALIPRHDLRAPFLHLCPWTYGKGRQGRELTSLSVGLEMVSVSF